VYWRDRDFWKEGPVDGLPRSNHGGKKKKSSYIKKMERDAISEFGGTIERRLFPAISTKRVAPSGYNFFHRGVSSTTQVWQFYRGKNMKLTFGESKRRHQEKRWNWAVKRNREAIGNSEETEKEVPKVRVARKPRESTDTTRAG